MGLAPFVQEYVGRLQVPVQDAALMGVVDGAGDRDQQPYAGPRVPPQARQVLGEVSPLDQLHAVIMLPFVDADFVDGHDVGVIEASRGLRLGVESIHVGRRSQAVGEDHFEGDQAVQAQLPRLVDDAHAAAGDLLQQLVITDVADGGPQRRGRPDCRRGDRLCRGSLLAPPQQRHRVAVGEIRLQFPGQVGVFGEEEGAIDDLAAVQPLHVIGEHLLQGSLPGCVGGARGGHRLSSSQSCRRPRSPEPPRALNGIQKK